MHKNAILNMLDSHDVSSEHLVLFKEKLKDKNFTELQCDKLLVKLGYEPLFSFEEDEEDYDYGYDSYEKTIHKTFEEV